MPSEVWGRRNGWRGSLWSSPDPPDKTGKLTGEVRVKGKRRTLNIQRRTLKWRACRRVRGDLDWYIEGMSPLLFAHAGDGLLLSLQRPVPDGGPFGDPSSAQGLSGLLRAGWWWGTVPGGRLRDRRGQARVLVPTADGASEILRCGWLPLVSDGHRRAATFFVDRSCGAQGATSGSGGGIGFPNFRRISGCRMLAARMVSMPA